MGQQGLQPEGEEDEDVEDKPFKDPFGALVKNCNMLHNIVGPACIFLKQGFSQTLVCKKKNAQSVHTVSSEAFFHSFRFTSILTSWLTLPPALHHNSCVIPPHCIGPGQRLCSKRSIIQFHGKLLTGFVELTHSKIGTGTFTAQEDKLVSVTLGKLFKDNM